jgi:tape measure domain-containing protein
MSELYRIALEDAVSGNAYRIAQAYVNVSVAAQDMAKAVRSSDMEMRKAAAANLQFHRTQLTAAKAAQTAGNAIARLGPKVQSVTPKVQALTKAKAASTAQSFKFSYALNALASAATNAAFALAGRTVDAMVDVGRGLYNVADLATRAHLSFANFYGGQEKGDRMLGESIEIAKRYGFTIADTVAQIQRFGAAGFDTEQSKGLLRFGADMMAAGRSVQDVKGIFLAMTQIQGKGKLQAEELTQQLAERGINAGRVWEILADKFKTTKENVMKMQKAGKIKPGAALNAIVQAGVEGVHGSRIGEAGKKVADATVGGLARKMSTEIESQIFSAVDNATPRLVKGMQSIFSGLTGIEGGNLQTGLTNMLKQVGDFLEVVGPKLPEIAKNFETAFGHAATFDGSRLLSFADRLPELASSLGFIAGSFVTIANAMSKIASFALTGDKGLRWSDVGGDDHSAVGKFMNGTPNKVLDNVGEFVFGVDPPKLHNTGEDLAGNIIDGLNFGITSGAAGVAKSTENVAQQGIDAFKETTETHSPSRVYKKLGRQTVEGYVLGVDNNADLAMHSTRMMADASVAAASGAQGLDPRRSMAAGAAAGASISSSSSSARVSIGDIYIGGGSGGGSGSGGAPVDQQYFETEFVALLERHLEGVGA